jgi:gamma-glutamyltranspeptidase/glutathione hydrolase
VQALGGFLTVDDLKAHTSSSFEPPISTVYKGIRLHEVPPNGQGLTALLALDILTELEMQGRVTMMGMSGSGGDELQGSGQVVQARSSSSSSSSSLWQGSVSQTHALVECMRIAFADTRFWVCDPVTGSSGDSSGGIGGSGSGATLALLNKGYAASRAQMFNEDKCALDATHGCPERSSSTVSFQVSGLFIPLGVVVVDIVDVSSYAHGGSKRNRNTFE